MTYEQLIAILRRPAAVLTTTGMEQPSVLSLQPEWVDAGFQATEALDAPRFVAAGGHCCFWDENGAKPIQRIIVADGRL